MTAPVEPGPSTRRRRSRKKAEPVKLAQVIPIDYGRSDTLPWRVDAGQLVNAIEQEMVAAGKAEPGDLDRIDRALARAYEAQLALNSLLNGSTAVAMVRILEKAERISELQVWLRVCRERYAPDAVVFDLGVYRRALARAAKRGAVRSEVRP